MSSATLNPLLDVREVRGTALFSIAPSSLEPDTSPVRPRFGQNREDRSTDDENWPVLSAEPKMPMLQRQEVNSPSTSNWDVRKRYQGVVISMTKDRIYARFRDATDHGAEIESEISVQEIPKAQRELLREGAFLVWMVGYVTDKVGTKRRNSEFYIRRVLRPSSYGKQLSQEIRTILSGIRWE